MCEGKGTKPISFKQGGCRHPLLDTLICSVKHAFSPAKRNRKTAAKSKGAWGAAEEGVDFVPPPKKKPKENKSPSFKQE